MKASDASRAATLVSALSNLDKLMAVESNPDFFFQMLVGLPWAKAGSQIDSIARAMVFLDQHTGNLIAAAAQKIIREQLEGMGVEL